MSRINVYSEVKLISVKGRRLFEKYEEDREALLIIKEQVFHVLNIIDLQRRWTIHVRYMLWGWSGGAVI